MITLIDLKKGAKVEWRYFDSLSPKPSNFTESYLAAEAAFLSFFDIAFCLQLEEADILKEKDSSFHN